jgi:energy-coupling factor transporter ATP-binding protein EcfA2
MPDTFIDTLKRLVLLLTQIPLFGGVWLWWNSARARPIVAIFICLLYETGIFFLAFGKKVWARLEDKAVQGTADWVLALASTFSPGFQRRYNRLIIDEHGGFNVRGLGLINTYRLSLDQVFVDLRVDPGNPQLFNLDIVAKERDLGGNRAIWRFLRQHKEDNEAVALAIIGPPGSGKSTLLRHVALTFAANRQHRYGVRPCTPILLSLRDHISAIDDKNSPSLGALLEQYFTDSGQFATLYAPANWFSKRLAKGKCVVLLDGLDEVADIAQRKRVSAWVDRQIRNYSRCHFILTARPQGYLDAPLQQADVVLEVQPFSSEQVRKFIESWYLANEIMSSGGADSSSVRQRASKDAQDLVKRLRAVPSLSALTVNPLLLTMIAMVHRYRGALPGSRVELYAEICEVLLERWRQARGIEDKLKASQKLVVLRPLAAYMIEHRQRDIRTEDAIPIITGPLNRVGINERDANGFLVELQANSGLLLEREAGYWSFAHLTFQEYLAAAYWLEQNDVQLNWGELVGDSWWHETLRLYAAQGDATRLVEACLDVDSIAALSLAADCLDESREISPEVRFITEDRLVSGLESADSARRRLASEVKLSRRLASLQRIDDVREIDTNYLTCAEYQLFLDDMRAQGKYYQPDHWKDFVYASGQGNQPITGVRPKDSQDFCDWLTHRQGGTLKYRLPSLEEAEQYPLKDPCLGAWCREEKRSLISGLADVKMPSLCGELAFFSKSDLPLPTRFDIDFYEELERAYENSKLHNWQRSINSQAMIDQLGRALKAASSSYGDHVSQLQLNTARMLARRLNLYSACNLTVAFARNLDQNVEADTQLANAVSGFVKSAQDLAPMVDKDLSSIVLAMEAGDFPSALQECGELMNDSNVMKAYVASILSDLITITRFQSVLTARQSRRKLFAQIFEQPQMALQIDSDDQHSWWRRFRNIFMITSLARQRVRNESEKAAEEGAMRQSFLNAFWFLQILLAREEDGFAAWEGIRIVREEVMADRS